LVDWPQNGKETTTVALSVHICRRVKKGKGYFMNSMDMERRGARMGHLNGKA
jgi:hypothetical protein